MFDRLTRARQKTFKSPELGVAVQAAHLCGGRFTRSNVQLIHARVRVEQLDQHEDRMAILAVGGATTASRRRNRHGRNPGPN